MEVYVQHWLIVLQIYLLQLNDVSDLFGPTENKFKVAGNLQELPTAFLAIEVSVKNKHPFGIRLKTLFLRKVVMGKAQLSCYIYFQRRTFCESLGYFSCYAVVRSGPHIFD